MVIPRQATELYIFIFIRFSVLFSTGFCISNLKYEKEGNLKEKNLKIIKCNFAAEGGHIRSIIRQKMDGLIPSGMDIKAFIPSPTFCLQEE